MDRDSFLNTVWSSGRSFRSMAFLGRLLGIFAIFFSVFFFPVKPADAQGPTARVADELLVTLRPGVAKQKARDIYHRNGADIVDEAPRINTHLIRVPAPALEAVRRALSRRPEFDAVEPNYIAEGSYTPSDERYPSQWHLPGISAPQGWDISTGSDMVPIAVIDSGVDPNHPDLSVKLLPGYNFVQENADTRDVLGHGTMVAGTAAALGDNLTGVAGVAWQNPVMPLVVLNSSNWATYYDIARAIIYAADNGVRVINISIGGSSSSTTLQNAVDYAWNKGAVIFAAAHNYATDTPYYPAACDHVVAVSATTSNDTRAGFSNYGDWIDLSAPGSSILTTVRGGGYGSASGTSFASPLAAGLAALILSANTTLSNAQVVETLEQHADDLGEPGFDPDFGWGRINAYESLVAAADIPPQLDTTEPLVSITSPGDGSTVAAGATVTVWATDDLGVAKVELYLDDILFAADTSAPFEFIWDTTQTSDGPHILQAVAYDAAGNTGYSDVLSVSVDNTFEDITPPEVSITAPEDGAVLQGSTTVGVSASDDIGVTAVEILLDGNPFAVDNAAPFSFLWDTTLSADGAYTLQARAYDAAGNTAVSPEVTVAVKNTVPDFSAPSIVITSPADGARVSRLIKVQVQAVDDTGLVRLDLLIDGTLNRTAICSASLCEMQAPWNPRKETVGGHTLTAVAYDGAGNEGVAEITVIVE